jgi:hypothetical protein
MRVTYPSVTAEVRFNRAVERWVCEAPDRSAILEELGQDASDQEIRVVSCAGPMVYRTVIIR